jgi:hypothetical protein
MFHVGWDVELEGRFTKLDSPSGAETIPQGLGVAPDDTPQVQNEVFNSLALVGNLYFHCKIKITANLLFWGFYV